MRTESAGGSRNSRTPDRSSGTGNGVRPEQDVSPKSMSPEADCIDPWLMAEIVLILAGILLALSLTAHYREPCFFAADYPACLDRS